MPVGALGGLPSSPRAESASSTDSRDGKKPEDAKLDRKTDKYDAGHPAYRRGACNRRTC